MNKFAMSIFSAFSLMGCSNNLSMEGNFPVLTPQEVNRNADLYDGKMVVVYGRVASKVHPWEMKIYDRKKILSGIEDACLPIKSSFLREKLAMDFFDNKNVKIKGKYNKDGYEKSLDGCFVGSSLIVDDDDLREKYKKLTH